MTKPKSNKHGASRAQLRGQIAHLNAQIISLNESVGDRIARNKELGQERDSAIADAKRSRDNESGAVFELNQLRCLVVEYSLLASNAITSDDKERVIHLPTHDRRHAKLSAATTAQQRTS